MEPDPRTRPIVILGPTAGGKSELAVGLAERFRGQVIGADSMQVYRRMDAGTAKPSAALRRRAVHHMIDLVEPTERFTVADWLERVETIIAELRVRGIRPIVVGGTNLYIKALLEGMFDGPELDPALRARLSLLSGAELHARLAVVDPPAAALIHPNDLKRLVRALEVFELTGKPMSAWQEQWGESGSRVSGFGSREERPGAQSPEPREDAEPRLPQASSLKPQASSPGQAYLHDPILIGLDWPVEAINVRINARVKAMFHPPSPEASPEASEFPSTDLDILPSLPDEVRLLESQKLLGPQARQALGYKQVLEHLAGLCTLDEAYEKTKILTRRYAKTQRTWLKRYRAVSWLPAAGREGDAILADAIGVVNHV